jgi:hypothetical protein
MEHHYDNIMAVATKMVEQMTREELEQYVFEDLCEVMDEKEIFDLNVESLEG